MPHPVRTTVLLLAATFLGVGSLSVQADTRVTYKSAASGTAYYQMGVELSESIKSGTEGDIVLTLEESQGSVQNVMEVAARTGNYVFTTPPGLIEQALAGEGVFAERQSPNFQDIRGLFPIPAITMHWVVAGSESGDGVIAMNELAGQEILIGRGTFGAREAERYIGLFDLGDEIEVANAEIDSGPDALKNGQIDGFVTASSFPTPNVIETASSMPISLVSMTEEQIAKTGATPQTIPADTYPGVKADVETTSLPVIAYTTTQMDDDTAYTLTKTFWERRDAMAEESPWWGAISPDMIGNMAGTLHPGALRYYEEADIEIPESLR
ncbi:TAXI family TRAP transporter solute-binding subunit [Aidingimonas lacisalsi]|uniref:TAXI family TRAP transporter solute-binding subunit n=1 Tax=Aidingimonas lacisalsi TaxID=2604086 RepID=UPI0011D25FA9|nr:TAXI family TRAP transporter solute-binding subunit [Aidingimonas lacisalsi]